MSDKCSFRSIPKKDIRQPKSAEELYQDYLDAKEFLNRRPMQFIEEHIRSVLPKVTYDEKKSPMGFLLISCHPMKLSLMPLGKCEKFIRKLQYAN